MNNTIYEAKYDKNDLSHSVNIYIFTFHSLYIVDHCYMI